MSFIWIEVSPIQITIIAYIILMIMIINDDIVTMIIIIIINDSVTMIIIIINDDSVTLAGNFLSNMATVREGGAVVVTRHCTGPVTPTRYWYLIKYTRLENILPHGDKFDRTQSKFANNLY